MVEVTVRPVTARDLADVAAMIRALAAHHGDAGETDAARLARDALGDPPWCRILVADAGGRLVGYAAFLPLLHLQYARRGLDMHHLFVAEGWRGRGVGSLLVEAGIQLARSLGCHSLSVGTAPGNKRAEAFYLSHGFEYRPPQGRRLRLMLLDRTGN